MRRISIALVAVLSLCGLARAASPDPETLFKEMTSPPWIALLPGNDLDAFRKPLGEWEMVGEVTQAADNPKALASKPGSGAIINGKKGRTSNLFTQHQHGDVAAHIEFLIPKGSNSGIYFQGRYEIQVYDSYGVEKDAYPGIECGGIYPRWIDNKNEGGHSPRVNASRKTGEWQSFDVIFRAPRFDKDGKKIANACFVKVIHNGQVIHENVEVTGPTRAAAFNDEKPLGPIMFQGDHGPVAYRNIRLLPLAEK